MSVPRVFATAGLSALIVASIAATPLSATAAAQSHVAAAPVRLSLSSLRSMLHLTAGLHMVNAPERVSPSPATVATASRLRDRAVNNPVALAIPFTYWPCACGAFKLTPAQIKNGNDNPNFVFHGSQKYAGVQDGVFQDRLVPIAGTTNDTIFTSWLGTRYPNAASATASFHDSTSTLAGFRISPSACPSPSGKHKIANCDVYGIAFENSQHKPVFYVYYGVFAVGNTVGEDYVQFSVADGNNSTKAKFIGGDFFILLWDGAAVAYKANGVTLPSSPASKSQPKRDPVTNVLKLEVDPGLWPNPENAGLLTPAQADSSVNPIPSFLRNKKYAASGMTKGVVQEQDAALGNNDTYFDAWLGSIYGSASQASARVADITAFLKPLGPQACPKPSGKSGATPNCALWANKVTVGKSTFGLFYGIFAVGNTVGEALVECSASDFGNKTKVQELINSFLTILENGIITEYFANGLKPPVPSHATLAAGFRFPTLHVTPATIRVPFLH